jgi:ubiquitin carboxyl-terminal hydrolase 4/11/15
MTTWGDPVWSFDSINRAPRNTDSDEIASDAPNGSAGGDDLQDRMLQDFGDEDDGVIGGSHPAASTPTGEDDVDEIRLVDRD